jgi:DNA-binding NtrC family response regulator
MKNEPNSLKNQTILIVEDEPRVGFALAMMLSQMGYAVMMSQHAHEALDVLDGGHDLVAIVADYQLYGELTGLDVLAMSKARHPHVRRILISGLLVPEHEEMWELICDAFLGKPFGWQQMAEALTAPLQNHVTGRGALSWMH